MIEQIAQALGLTKLAGETINLVRTEFEAVNRRLGKGDTTALRLQIAQLSEKIADTQLKLHDITQKLVEAQGAIEDFEAFREERAHYGLVKLAGGGIVLERQLHQGSVVPHHYICAPCAQHLKISYLQPAGRHLRCPECGEKFDNEPPPEGGIVKVNRGHWGEL
ncbi:hypothetical protein [Profundibacterium mesophilum]|uniref:hypothetical protein n=1 Tax=Profundibacterium mesophilum TaxID=1258573 RepID=UPI00135A536B|nr:hypothetical protein [Profundibacterium mesophilum]